MRTARLLERLVFKVPHSFKMFDDGIKRLELGDLLAEFDYLFRAECFQPAGYLKQIIRGCHMAARFKTRKLPAYGGASPGLPPRPRPPKTISGRRPVVKPPPKLAIGSR